MIGSGLSHKVNLKLGTPRQLFGAMLLVALVIGSVALWQPDTPVWVIALFFFVLPLGMGNVMAPGTEAVMSAVPEEKAGVGSAMNDVNRQVAGALGVAVIGSVSSSAYSSNVESATTALPPSAAARGDGLDRRGRRRGGATCPPERATRSPSRPAAPSRMPSGSRC